MTYSRLRLVPISLVLLIASPLFAFRASPPPAASKSDMVRLASDLEVAFGADNIVITSASRPAPMLETRTATPVSTDDVALIEAMNRERTSRGLSPLHVNQVLCAAAADRVRDMFAKHYFNHVSPDGIDPFTWAIRRGYDYRNLGENLAIGYRRAADVVDGWMHSPGHRRNLLGTKYDEVGVAIAHGSPTSRFAGPLVVAIYGAQLQ